MACKDLILQTLWDTLTSITHLLDSEGWLAPESCEDLILLTLGWLNVLLLVGAACFEWGAVTNCV